MRLFLVILLMAASAVAYAEISVSDAWVRATPPGAQTAAVYLTLHNSGADDALVGAKVTVAKEAQLHTHRHDQGMMRMEQVDSFRLMSGQSVALKPGGNHLMLMDISQPMEPGNSIELALIFDLNEPLEIEVPVRDGRTQ